MTSTKASLAKRLQLHFRGLSYKQDRGEITLTVPAKKLHRVCLSLRDNRDFRFEQLIDICGVDWSEYGEAPWDGLRYAAVYHLLSVSGNMRLRLKVPVDGDPPVLDSVVDIWAAANWFEREAFDLMGIVFDGHPDLRRLLTDYGFIGHPFRKDFPLRGNVEMRYDAEQRRVIYEPVTIDDRILVPRTIRKDTFTSTNTDEATD